MRSGVKIFTVLAALGVLSACSTLQTGPVDPQPAPQPAPAPTPDPSSDPSSGPRQIIDAIEGPDLGEIRTVSRGMALVSQRSRVISGGQTSTLLQELYYDGIESELVNLSYREFVNTNDAPTYSSRLNYNIEPSTLMLYRQAMVEVIEADADSITYRIMSYFSEVD